MERFWKPHKDNLSISGCFQPLMTDLHLDALVLCTGVTVLGCVCLNSARCSCSAALDIITHYIIYNTEGLFFPAFVEFHLPVFTSSFSSAVTIETLHPYQPGAFGCRAHWLSQERDTGEQVFPWHDFGTDVVRTAFTWLWQGFLGSRHPADSGTSTRFVTTGWRLRNVKSNWERSSAVIEMGSPGRQMLCGTRRLSTVHAHRPPCRGSAAMAERGFSLRDTIGWSWRTRFLFSANMPLGISAAGSWRYVTRRVRRR